MNFENPAPRGSGVFLAGSHGPCGEARTSRLVSVSSLKKTPAACGPVRLQGTREQG